MDFVPAQAGALKANDLKKLQFYLSHGLLLMRPQTNEAASVDKNHRLLYVNNTTWDSIYFPAGTPCLVTSVQKQTRQETTYQVSFEKNTHMPFHSTGGSLCWPFSSQAAVPDTTLKKSLMATAKQYGLLENSELRVINYAGHSYYLLGMAWLQVEQAAVAQPQNRQRTVPGLQYQK